MGGPCSSFVSVDVSQLAVSCCNITVVDESDDRQLSVECSYCLLVVSDCMCVMRGEVLAVWGLELKDGDQTPR